MSSPSGDGLNNWGPRTAGPVVQSGTLARWRATQLSLLGSGLFLVFLGLGRLITSRGSSQLGGALSTVVGVLFCATFFWLRGGFRGRSRLRSRVADGDGPSASEQLRRLAWLRGGGVVIGRRVDGAWLAVPKEQAIMIIGPPRSGKTSGVIVPAISSALGPVVCTSTKPDLLHYTGANRARMGRLWLFDPSGEEALPAGVLPLRWSPVRRGRSWDAALTMARSMVDAGRTGTGGESEFWNERAGALLAGCIHAASFGSNAVSDVRRWILQQELGEPIIILEDFEQNLAAEVLNSFLNMDNRALGSVFLTAGSIISAYNAHGALSSAQHANFDPGQFSQSSDTVYITLTGQLQDRLAPLVVGLLEDIRRAQYLRHRRDVVPRDSPAMLWALDETANIAPLRTLPALLSDGGGQGIQALCCFQDLSQARARWGEAANGFISLFGSKIVFSGIADMQTLQALSNLTGVWDRPQVQVTQNYERVVKGGRGFRRPLPINSVVGGAISGSSVREPVLHPGEISRLPSGFALHISSNHWELMKPTPPHVDQLVASTLRGMQGS